LTAGNFLPGLSTKAQTAGPSSQSLPSMRHKIVKLDNSDADQSQGAVAATSPSPSAKPETTSSKPLSTPSVPPGPAVQTTAEVETPTAVTPALVARADQRAYQPTNRLDDMLPLFLGHIAVKRHETLGVMIQKIYGLYNNSYLNYISKVNPNIINPDNIRTGELILFPAIPAQVKPLPVPVYWVAIDEKASIEEAYNVLRALPAGIPAGRLIPYWSSREGLRFKIVLRRYFFDEKSAHRQLNKLTALLPDTGRVFSSWDESSVFFANPY
jgi:hypothetical protein